MLAAPRGPHGADAGPVAPARASSCEGECPGPEPAPPRASPGPGLARDPLVAGAPDPTSTCEEVRRQWELVCSASAWDGDASGVDATVVVFDDRDIREVRFLQLNCELNEGRCDRLGFDFLFVGGPHWPELRRMPPHWARVAHLEAMAARRPHGEHSFLISLDSDAALANPLFPLRRLLAALPREKSVFLAKDPPMWPPPQDSEWASSGVFCAGFVLVRLDEPGRRFLSRWRGCFDPSRWRRDGSGCWSTEGRWAGSAYEQGMLNALAHGELAHVVFELPQSLFNSAWVRAGGAPQPVVAHLMRRPGEWAPGEKDGRVAAAFGALLEPARLGRGSGPQDDGLPRDVASLRAWEAEACCGG